MDQSVEADSVDVGRRYEVAKVASAGSTGIFIEDDHQQRAGLFRGVVATGDAGCLSPRTRGASKLGSKLLHNCRGFLN